jgi:hypothetical protein
VPAATGRPEALGLQQACPLDTPACLAIRLALAASKPWRATTWTVARRICARRSGSLSRCRAARGGPAVEAVVMSSTMAAAAPACALSLSAKAADGQDSQQQHQQSGHR